MSRRGPVMPTGNGFKTTKNGSIILSYDSLNHWRTKGERGLGQCRQIKWEGGGVREYGGIDLCLLYLFMCVIAHSLFEIYVVLEQVSIALSRHKILILDKWNSVVPDTDFARYLANNFAEYPAK